MVVDGWTFVLGRGGGRTGDDELVLVFRSYTSNYCFVYGVEAQVDGGRPTVIMIKIRGEEIREARTRSQGADCDKCE